MFIIGLCLNYCFPVAMQLILPCHTGGTIHDTNKPLFIIIVYSKKKKRQIEKND